MTDDDLSDESSNKLIQYRMPTLPLCHPGGGGRGGGEEYMHPGATTTTKLKHMGGNINKKTNK